MIIRSSIIPLFFVISILQRSQTDYSCTLGEALSWIVHTLIRAGIPFFCPLKIKNAISTCMHYDKKILITL